MAIKFRTLPLQPLGLATIGLLVVTLVICPTGQPARAEAVRGEGATSQPAASNGLLAFDPAFQGPPSRRQAGAEDRRLQGGLTTTAAPGAQEEPPAYPVQLQSAPDGSRLSSVQDSGSFRTRTPRASDPEVTDDAILRTLLATVSAVLAVFALFRLARMFGAWCSGQIFIERNVRDLAAAAWLTMSIGVLQGMADIIPDLVLGRSPILHIGAISLHLGVLVGGIVLFLFARAVDEGAKLADEAGHTV